MDRSIEKYLKAFGIAVLALVLVSVATGYAPLLVRTKAQVAPTITFSSSNLNPVKVVRIQITDPGNVFLGASKIRLQVLSSGVPVPVITRSGASSSLGIFNATLVSSNPNTYVAFLGGNLTDISTIPRNPGIVDADSIAKITASLSPGTLLTISAGPGVSSAVINYTSVAPTVSLSASQYPYRRNAIITITFTDQDLNKDPTYPDTLSLMNLSYINVSITVIKGAGGQVGPIITNVTNISAIGFTQAVESDVNSGSFTFRTSILNLSMVLGYNISRDDIVLMNFTVLDPLLGGVGFGPSPTSNLVSFRAVYTPPRISVSVTPQVVTVTINSPDDNVDPTVKDTLDTGAEYGLPSAYLFVALLDVNGNIIGNAFDSKPVSLLGPIETDVNTGVFVWNFSVSWGSGVSGASVSIPGKSILLPTNFDGPIYIFARYYTPVGSRPVGYNIDARTAAPYTPTLASFTVVKATLKSWIINMTKPDLNNNPNSITQLIPVFNSVAGNASFDLYLNSLSGPVVGRMVIVDSFGNPLQIKPGFGATDLLSFAQPDLNSNVLVLRINATLFTSLVSGATYFIRYTDLAGFSASKGLVIVNLTVAPVAIILDRSEYPVNRNGVTVYIRYVNDFYNRDPTFRDFAYVNVTITAVDGTQLYSATNVLLRETAIDTGVFSGGIVIPASVFSTPKIVDATLTVVDTSFTLPDGSNPTAKAVFRPHPASISVNATAVDFGAVVQITVNDPDANADSGVIESVTVTVSTPRTSFQITLQETDYNTGVFVGTLMISWDDPRLEKLVYPGDTITFEYDDNTPVVSPTTNAWPPPVPYIAPVKVRTHTGQLQVVTAVPDSVGPFENFNVFVKDPDLSRYVYRSYLASINDGYVALSVEGVPTTALYQLNETGAHTGVFTAITSLNITYVLMQAGIITPSDMQNPLQLASKLAQYVGKTVTVAYVDMANDQGVRQVILKTLKIRAFNPSISTTPSDFVNIGETLTINVYNPTIANTTIPSFKLVTVRSTTYPTGLQFYMEEVKPGLFQVNITVVDLNSWIPQAFQIPAKIGDTITIEYLAPITENGTANVFFTKTLIVGRFLEKPARVSSVDLLDPATGSPVTPKVNTPVLIRVNLTNLDIIDRDMTAFVIVRDANNVTVALFAGSATVRAGGSTALAFQWVPFAPGKFTIEVIVVKSFTDRTALAPDVFRTTITVSS